MKFSQVRMLVDDFDECFRFYSDVLGLTPSLGAADEDYASFSAGIAYLRDPDANLIELFQQIPMARA